MTAPAFTRSRAESRAALVDAGTALREVLAADGLVEVYDEVEAAPDRLAFTLHGRGHGVIAWTPGGSHLGTFGDALIGVQHAFAKLDHAAQEQPAPRIKGRHPMRGTATGEHR